MLTDNVGNALGLDLARMLIFGRTLVFLALVKCGVADLMEHGLDGLLLAHAGADKNFLRDMIEAALGCAGRRGI